MSLVDGTPDDARRLLDCLPQSPRGRMLITTRTSAVANSVADPQNVVKLTEMSLGEGKRYLETCLSDNHELLRKDDVDGTLSCLMERLEYLPLAVAQAVTYMNVNCMSVSEYVRHHGEMQQDRDNTGPTHLFGSQLRDETFHSRSQGSILTTWYASFMAIRNTSAHAAQLLSFLRWTSPKGIPTSVLPLGQGLKKAEAINLLCSYNFLSRREGGRILDMHRLVHLALGSCSKQLFDEEQTQETISRLNRVSPIFPNEHVQKQELWQSGLPHVLPLGTGETDNTRSASPSGIFSSHHVYAGIGAGKQLLLGTQQLVEVKKETSSRDNQKRIHIQSELGMSGTAEPGSVMGRLLSWKT